MITLTKSGPNAPAEMLKEIEEKYADWDILTTSLTEQSITCVLEEPCIVRPEDVPKFACIVGPDNG